MLPFTLMVFINYFSRNVMIIKELSIKKMPAV
jgi:hypothetical protein